MSTPFQPQIGKPYLARFGLNTTSTSTNDSIDSANKNTQIPTITSNENVIISSNIDNSKSISNDNTTNLQKPFENDNLLLNLDNEIDHCEIENASYKMKNTVEKSKIKKQKRKIKPVTTKKNMNFPNAQSLNVNTFDNDAANVDICLNDDNERLVDNDEPHVKYLKNLTDNRVVASSNGLAGFKRNVHQDFQCIPVGNELRIGKDIFFSKRQLFKTEFIDYTLITDAPFDVNAAPHELKPLLVKRWRYKLHVNPTLTPVITRSILRDRVIGGQILAYRYTECSIDGNSCVYYGFIPTIEKDFPDAHRICYVASIAVWPRKLYIYLKSSYTCNCRPGCTTWTSHLSDYQTTRRFCVNDIKWSDLYVMMGDFDRTCTEGIKSIRSCEICAQCYNCSTSTDYCRKHRVCRHKTAKPLEDVARIVQSKMKTCIKYK